MRFHARLVERDGVIVLTATNRSGAVGYALFDKLMSHLHYIETRKDCRRRGVASTLWAKVRELAGHLEVTASADTEGGKRRLTAWGFREPDGMWTFEELENLISSFRPIRTSPSLGCGPLLTPH